MGHAAMPHHGGDPPLDVEGEAVLAVIDRTAMKGSSLAHGEADGHSGGGQHGDHHGQGVHHHVLENSCEERSGCRCARWVRTAPNESRARGCGILPAEGIAARLT
ncbi:MAG: hypothetical protein EA346_10050 [Thioalkalivibrio sp.]|nr:MAG: hypothetical protein EA346_10050 [Thioalkalivibrio sp.]